MYFTVVFELTRKGGWRTHHDRAATPGGALPVARKALAHTGTRTAVQRDATLSGEKRPKTGRYSYPAVVVIPLRFALLPVALRYLGLLRPHLASVVRR